jgi:protein transport protein SEC31
MPPTSRPIYDTLSAELSRVKQSNLPVSLLRYSWAALIKQAHVTRIVDDTERRLNILFDGLNNETVPRQAVDQMNNIAKGVLISNDSS